MSVDVGYDFGFRVQKSNTVDGKSAGLPGDTQDMYIDIYIYTYTGKYDMYKLYKYIKFFNKWDIYHINW